MKPQENTNENAYKEMARFYDAMMGGNKYHGWKALMADIIKKYAIKEGACLDIACGTGNISKLLSELGFSIIGVDKSSHMLDIAQNKFPQELFICSSIKDLSLSLENQKKITFAVSFYDSLNYILTLEEMQASFEAVFRNLPSGTIFLFDMNTPEHVMAAQKYGPRIFENESFYSVYKFSGTDNFWVLDIDIFIRDGNVYRLVREKHTERGYSESDISPLLQNAGFSILEVREEYKEYPNFGRLPSRLYFVAQKK